MKLHKQNMIKLYNIASPWTSTYIPKLSTHTNSYTSLLVNYTFQWKENTLLMKISQAISRTTGPNICLFALILMHFAWFQIWTRNVTLLNCFENFMKKMVDIASFKITINGWTNYRYTPSSHPQTAFHWLLLPFVLKCLRGLRWWAQVELNCPSPSMLPLALCILRNMVQCISWT